VNTPCTYILPSPWCPLKRGRLRTPEEDPPPREAAATKTGVTTALAQAAGIVATLTVVSKVFGFLRESALAHGFGATTATDAYLVAQTVPTALFAAGAAVGIAFIPVFAGILEKEGRQVAYRTASTVMNATIWLAAVVIVVGELLAAPLVRLVAPGFEGDALVLTALLTRCMFPMILFQALNGLFTGMLQTERDFAAPALVALLFNGVIIASILALGPIYGIPAVACGTTAAAAAQALAQYAVLRRRGFRWTPTLDWKDPHLRRLGILLVPIVAGSVAGQMGAVVEKMLASGLPEGSISALNYGTRLVQFPNGVIGTSIVTVLYPTLASLASGGDRERFRLALSQGVRVVCFFMVPLAVGLALLREPIVALAFQRGRFDAAATEASAFALLFLSIGLVGFTLRELLSRAYYSLQDTRTPMFVGLAGLGLNIGLNLVLTPLLRQGGLALGAALSALLTTTGLLYLLRRRLGHIDGKAIVSSLVKILVASGAMAAAAQGTHGLVQTLWPGSGLGAQALRLGAVAGVGAVVYGIAAALLRLPELRTVAELGGRMGKRFGRGGRVARSAEVTLRGSQVEAGGEGPERAGR